MSVGAENVTATLSAPVIGVTSVTYYLNVVPVPVKPPPTLLQELRSFWYYIAAAVVAAIAAAFYMLRMRRKKEKAEIEAGFEVV
jgi:branched-subunit amino acid transport protein